MPWLEHKAYQLSDPINLRESAFSLLASERLELAVKHMQLIHGLLLVLLVYANYILGNHTKKTCGATLKKHVYI